MYFIYLEIIVLIVIETNFAILLHNTVVSALAYVVQESQLQCKRIIVKMQFVTVNIGPVFTYRLD